MQVVILAAGLGNRLRPMTEETPKCLVEVNGVPIIVRVLDILSRYPVKRFVIVLGHLGEKVKEKLGDRWKNIDIVYVHNPDYAKTNNIYSLWTAREHLDRDTILMECDILFESAVIDRLLSHQGENVALVDVFKSYMDGTVVEVDPDGMISKMIPARDQSDTFNYNDKFKTVNIYYFLKSFLTDIFIPNLDLYVKTGKNDQYYELILTILVYMGQHKIRAVLVDGKKWMEIDDFSDLERAEILFSDKPSLYRRVQSIHGGYWRYDFLDFSYLYNLDFPTQTLLNELSLNIQRLLGHYPSAQREIAAALANWTGLNPEFLAVGNGASEIITVLKKDFVKKITIPVPTFNEYETHLSKEQIQYFVCDTKEYSLDVDGYVGAVEKSGSNVALIINPNNPTSQYVEPSKLEYILKQLSGLDVFILDESFIDFVTEDPSASMVKHLSKFKNLVIVKSLSKNLGIPGLRLGYAASTNKKIIERLRASLPIWNINSLTEYFIGILTKYRGEYKTSCLKTMENRDYLYQQLLTVQGVTPFKPSANFVFLRLDGAMDSHTLKERLFLEWNILIKDCSNKTGLENGHYVRLAARHKAETDFLIRAMKKVLSRTE